MDDETRNISEIPTQSLSRSSQPTNRFHQPLNQRTQPCQEPRYANDRQTRRIKEEVYIVQPERTAKARRADHEPIRFSRPSISVKCGQDTFEDRRRNKARGSEGGEWLKEEGQTERARCGILQEFQISSVRPLGNFASSQQKEREWELGLITEAQLRMENTQQEKPFYSYRLFRR